MPGSPYAAASIGSSCTERLCGARVPPVGAVVLILYGAGGDNL